MTVIDLPSRGRVARTSFKVELIAGGDLAAADWPSIADVRDRRPIGQIAAGNKLDLEGGARNASTRGQINDSHAYALLLNAATPPANGSDSNA